MKPVDCNHINDPVCIIQFVTEGGQCINLVIYRVCFIAKAYYKKNLIFQQQKLQKPENSAGKKLSSSSGLK